MVATPTSSAPTPAPAPRTSPRASSPAGSRPERDVDLRHRPEPRPVRRPALDVARHPAQVEPPAGAHLDHREVVVVPGTPVELPAQRAARDLRRAREPLHPAREPAPCAHG